ncbi:SAM-dependent methyltransferase [Streptomyces sp. NPDC088256]|uniref:SAM-dependent methyltransferase n=1 Tax=Streptomyces sp. NPDC088256 TaxID=3365848 RepID=UPI0038307577
MTDIRRVDLSIPSAARMYDWLLDGHHNYEADQRACELLLESAPSTKALARNNRWFLERVVRVMAEERGIRQFIDFGSGLPTQNNVHQIAQAVAPASRVVYIDNDPVVLAHGRSILDENDRTAIISADMGNTPYIFGHLDFTSLIDLRQPVGVLFNSVLHCIADEDRPKEIVGRVVERLEPGSLVVICQLVSDDPQLRHDVTELMRVQTHGTWGRVRERWEVDDFFDGLEVQRPGLVDVTDWRPSSELQQRQRSIEWTEYGGLAEVPPRQRHRSATARNA